MGPRRLVVLLVLLAAASALQPPSSQEVGYAFEYGVRDERSGTLYAHTEFRHGIVTTGQYTVHLPDGRIQTVKYTADQNGYRATVSYEGLAHHPDKIIDKPSKPTNYPPAIAGRPVPVVGRTVLNRPSTIPQATSVSHSQTSYHGHSHDPLASDNTGFSTPGSSERVPSEPITIQRVPVGADISPNIVGFRGTTFNHSGNFQRGSQYTGAPISPHLIHSNILASHERDSNSYVPSQQNIDNAGSLEQPHAPPVSPGRYPAASGESYGHSSFSVPLRQHQDASLQAGRYASGSFPPNQHFHVSNSGTQVPVVPFGFNNVPLVPSRTQGASVVSLVPENVSFISHSQNIPVTPTPGKVPIVAHTSPRVIVPTVPFTQDPSKENPLFSFPQNSQGIFPHNSLPTFVSQEEHSLIEPSQNKRQKEPVRNTFRVPHKLQSDEQDLKRFPQSFNFNQQSTFSSSNTPNFNEFYNLPSRPQTRPRKLPPNTFIPSAIDPQGPPDASIPTGHNSISHQESEFLLGGNHLKQQIPPHLQGYGDPVLSRFAPTHFNKQPTNSFSSGHSSYQYGTLSDFGQSSSVHNRPFEPNSSPSVSGTKFENSNQIDLNSNQGDQSVSVPNNLESHYANSVFIAHDLKNQGASQNNSDGQSSQSGRPIPKPIIVPNQEPFLPSLETKYSSGVRSPFTTGFRSQNVIFRPINEIDPLIFKKPFMIDPDASVFHNEPSIIVDYSHRGSSHDDSRTVSLAAPYVFVGGAYSPNPASKFAVKPVINPNSVAAHGIAPPDPADAGNIRLSPGFLPPHLAKLQKHRDEIRTVPTPEPVQLKLAPRRNLEIIGVERKNLPLRNQPDTFGEGTKHAFIPNSVSKTLNSRKHRRNILDVSDTGESEQKSVISVVVLKKSGAEVESSPLNAEFSSKESVKVEVKPNIRNG